MIVGLDAGSRYISVFVAEVDEDGLLRFVNATRVPSRGISGGVVTSIPDATAAIARAVAKVEERLPHRIASACVGVGDEHQDSQNVTGSVYITPHGRVIVPDDVSRAVATARAKLQQGENRRILHEIPRAFKVDGHPGVRDPLGMAASVLDVEVHCATASANILQNLLTCVQGAGIHQVLPVANPLAAGDAIFDAYRDRQCVAVIDIGYQTTKLAVYHDGTIWHTHVLRLGGQGFTDALVSQMHLPPHVAERVKLDDGSCDPRDASEMELVEIPALGDDVYAPRSEIIRVLREHADEFADAIDEWLRRLRSSGVIPTTIVLVGGGAELPGLDALLASALDVEVEIGAAVDVHGVPGWADIPAFATAAGLARWYGTMTGGMLTRGGRRSPSDGPRSFFDLFRRSGSRSS
jgi:cell division protein FtsA